MLFRSDPAAVRKMAGQFYSELYAAGSLDQNCTKVLHNDLPQLDQQQKQALDSALTFEEVTKAVYQLTSGRAPGIDGLPVDFYKAFWGVIGEDLFSVFQACFGFSGQGASKELPACGPLSLAEEGRPLLT